MNTAQIANLHLLIVWHVWPVHLGLPLTPWYTNVYGCSATSAHLNPSDIAKRKTWIGIHSSLFAPGNHNSNSVLMNQTLLTSLSHNIQKLIETQQYYKYCLPRMWHQSETPWDLFVLESQTKTGEPCGHQCSVQLVGCTSWMQFPLQRFSPAFHTVFGHTTIYLKMVEELCIIWLAEIMISKYW